MMAFSYRRTITIDYTKCGTANSTDFPMLISGTYDGTGGIADLRTTGNGGKVTNASGYDIGFYSDAALTTKLSWETEQYTATTGLVKYWVKIPTLSASADTVIYLAYGNSAISTDQSAATTTWDSNYLGVYHLGDGTTLSVADSMNIHNGTNNSATATTGQIYGGVNYSGSSQYIALGNIATFSDTQTVTLECWLKSSTNGQWLMGNIQYGKSGVGLNLGLGTANKAAMMIGNYSGAGDGGGIRHASGGTSVQDGTWRHVVATYDGSQSSAGIKIYLNGVAESMTSNSNTAPSVFDNTAFRLGSIPYGYYATAVNDEIRISNTARSVSYALASYNNQNSPSAFYTLGSEVIIPRGGTFGLMGVG